jgi:hypothetical protein
VRVVRTVRAILSLTWAATISNHAESFAFALANLREDCPGRPIISSPTVLAV